MRNVLRLALVTIVPVDFVQVRNAAGHIFVVCVLRHTVFCFNNDSFNEMPLHF